MSLKSKWENCRFENGNPYAWIFIRGRMFVVNDIEYQRKIKENYLKKNGFCKKTKINKEKNS